MDERKIKILCSIIEDFICTGEPVASRTLFKKYNLGISSATIRNEMSDLEELGFLEQIHTSSGRKPSNKGYRLYVDKLMPEVPISKEDEIFIRDNLENIDLFDIENALRTNLLSISKLTNLACILKIPPVIKSSIKTIQLLKIDEGNVLAVTVTNEGIIKTTLIKLSQPISENDLFVSTKIINQKLVGLTVEEINLKVIVDLKIALKSYNYILEKIIPGLYEALSENKTGECYLEGAINILNNPEFRDIDEAKNFLDLFSDEGKFYSLLKSDRDIDVRIGNENFVEEAQNYSIILGNYKKCDKIIGTIALIGPTRMYYPKVISILTFIINLINLSIKEID